VSAAAAARTASFVIVYLSTDEAESRPTRRH
jgi:hypothetical protein